MLYRPVLAMVIVAVIYTCSACAGQEDDLKDPGTEDSAQEDLLTEEDFLTEEELIRSAGLTEEQYDGIDLGRFIDDFAITEENVDSLNIPLLLEEYMPDSMISDVRGILEDHIAERAGNYTDSVCAIAFYENKVTDTECVYYDLETGKRYRASNLYLFSDLKQTEPEDYEDGEKLAGELERHGVFSWKSAMDEDKNGEITDPQSMTLSVEYADGTVFRVSASGILSQALPEEYGEVRDMLLSGEK